MTVPKNHEAERLIEQAQRDSERFEAFLKGYVHGAQDLHSGNVPDGKDPFNEHVTELFRDEYPETWL